MKAYTLVFVRMSVCHFESDEMETNYREFEYVDCEVPLCTDDLIQMD